MRAEPWTAVADADWSDHRWQLRRQLRTADQLARVVRLTAEEREACVVLADRFRLGVTPYYASLIDPDDPGCPIRRQAIPTLAESRVHPDERPDPLAEERDMPVVGLTRRYPDRALLYLTHTCAVYCRHCTRRRKVSDPASAPPPPQIDAGIAWISANPAIRDVVLSGGDPLSLADAALDRLLGRLRAIPHVEMIRIGTRHPTTLPMRITPDLARVLAAHPPIYVMTHFNHPRECTPEAMTAADRLIGAGCVIANQSVLLRGVNDDPAVLRELSRRLLAMRIRPYRLFQCDLSEGTSHFRVGFERAVALIDALRGHLSGLGVPELVVDLPDGHGKVPLHPGVVVESGAEAWTFRSFRGARVRVPQVDGVLRQRSS